MSTPTEIQRPGRHAFRALELAWPWLNARLRLRSATRLGRRVYLYGRPRVANQGTLIIGSRVRLYSHVSTLELATLPGGRLEIGDRVSINHGSTLSAASLVKRLSHSANREICSRPARYKRR